MELFRIKNRDEYNTYLMRNQSALAKHQLYLDSFKRAVPMSFKVPGFSYTAKKQVEFEVPEAFQFSENVIVWREALNCPLTGFNNRMRATFHLFDIEMEPFPDQAIYIAEQLTPIYSYFKQKFPATIGSEFLGEKVPLGKEDTRGIRNEDLCALTFEDATFDSLVSLDVFEHIPDYMKAFKECARVLKPGGRMMWSVPFISVFEENLIRSKIVDGKIEHIHPPEYHGDPLSDDGVLCFQHFGWQMLRQIEEAGFSEAYAITYQAAEFGYLGADQFMFFASK